MKKISLKKEKKEKKHVFLDKSQFIYLWNSGFQLYNKKYKKDKDISIIIEYLIIKYLYKKGEI